MDRRKFLKNIAGGATVTLITPTYFLPPAGGWIRLAGWHPYPGKPGIDYFALFNEPYLNTWDDKTLIDTSSQRDWEIITAWGRESTEHYRKTLIEAAYSV